MQAQPPRMYWLLYLMLLSVCAGVWFWTLEPARVVEAFRAKSNISWGVTAPGGSRLLSVITNGSHISIRRNDATVVNSTAASWRLIDEVSGRTEHPAEAPPKPHPPECYCSGENFCAESMLGSKIGKPFSCDLLPYLHQFGLTDLDTPVERQTPTELIVFVSAASSNHFELARSWIRSLRRRHPNAPVVFWDLGLTEQERAEAANWCGVMVREFPYADYPDHLANKFNYAWKVIIKAIHFKEKDFFVWEDASVRAKPNYNFAKIHDQIVSHQIEATFPPFFVSHSIFATTAPGFYDYFPMNETIAKQWHMKAATLQFIFPNEYTRRMLKWELLCALTPDCIAPSGHQLDCVFAVGDRMTKYANCHRYDQSLMNAVIVRSLVNDVQTANNFGYTKAKAFTSISEVVDMEKQRRRRLRPLEMFSINRNDLVKEPVVLPCGA